MVTMESLSMVLSSSPPFQNRPKTPKFTSSKPLHPLSSSSPISISIPHFSNPHQTPFKSSKPLQFSLLTNSPILQTLTKTHLSFSIFELCTGLPSLASETALSSTELASNKIDLEAIVVSVDDFFNRNPFFVFGCFFVWLVVIPITSEFLSKCKFISAIDAYRKLQDNHNVQLLDIRDGKSLVALGSPNLKIVKKSVVQVEFSEENEDGFVKKVLESFADPANTIVCILDNLDDNSMKVAELLFKNGFQEAYAIRGGVKGKKGWLAIQEMLLPPSVHIKPKKKKKRVKITEQVGMNGGVNQQTENDNEGSSSTSVPIRESQRMENNGHVNKSTTSIPHLKIGYRSSSPYPNFPDLKPPSSPTPSKP
ncbi:hypothetical protein CFOL_v3_11886, partial [Cephalotus follicularis]